MPSTPNWFSLLNWKRLTVFQANQKRAELGSYPGVYAFTERRPTLLGGEVLYVGMTRQPLRRRLGVYLKDYDVKTRGNRRITPRGHKGARMIWSERNKLGDRNIIVHTAPFSGSRQETYLLEANLIHLLQPVCNTRDEELYHPLLDDDEIFFEPGFFEVPSV